MNQEHLEKCIQLRHLLHRNAELSGQETQTIQIIKSFLSEHTPFCVVEREGWLYVQVPGTGHEGTVAVRADMDALPIEEDQYLPYHSVNPGVSHKCGHDGHSASLCGLALELAAHPPKQDVILLFQPAEETGAGALLCKEILTEKHITEIYAFHNRSGLEEGTLFYKRGLTQPASEGITLEFSGKTSHAAAPEMGKNPARAMAEVVQKAGQLFDIGQNRDSFCTITGIHLGEGDFGISPGTGEVYLTLRAAQERDLSEMEQTILSLAKEQALFYGLRFESRIADRFPETANHDRCLEKIMKAAEKAGIPVRELEECWRPSEDFGHYLKNCSGAMVYLGNGTAYPPVHTKEYDFNDRLISVAVDLFLTLLSI